MEFGFEPVSDQLRAGPSYLTLTFKLVRARNQTRLPCELGANPFSGDISHTNKTPQTDGAKNGTFRSSLRAVERRQLTAVRRRRRLYGALPRAVRDVVVARPAVDGARRRPC